MLSTETIETVRDWEPRTVTSIFTQLLSSVPMWLHPEELSEKGAGEGEGGVIMYSTSVHYRKLIHAYSHGPRANAKDNKT